MKEFIKKVIMNMGGELFSLSRHGISMSSHTTLDNVVFTKGDKTFEISCHCFYGYSRLCYLTEDLNDRKIGVRLVPVTDQDWFNNYMKPLILKHFQ